MRSGSNQGVLASVSLSRVAEPKRGRSNAPVDNWYPYYAGYSHAFASHVIDEMCGGRSCTVLDPWNGSGTTTAAAAFKGKTAIGLDLNPATLAIASAKLVSRRQLKEVPRLLVECIHRAQAKVGSGVVPIDEPLLEWTSDEVAVFARHAFEWLVPKTTRRGHCFADPKWSAVALCLLRALRTLSVETRSNQAWERPIQGADSTRIADVAMSAVEIANSLAESRHLLPQRRADAVVRLGDVRSLPIAAESVDLVLTSPPYCTRIDYAQKMRFELAALFGYDDLARRNLRVALMGTTTIRREGSESGWLPDSVRQVLGQIQHHPSHRSGAYYYRNYAQYFSDATLAIREISRVLKLRGRAVFVLQNSYYKEIPVQLTDLFADMARSSGLKPSVLIKRRVARAMTAMNPRAKKYSVVRHYTEDVLLLERVK